MPDIEMIPSEGVRRAVARAMRVDDVVREAREQWGRRRGLTPTVIPYAGYGGDGWLRVLGRVLLTTRQDGSPVESVRGWRSFMSVAVDHCPVRVTVDGVDRIVHADRGGVVDERIEADLAPGWHRVTMRAADPGGEEGPPVEAPVFVLRPDTAFGIVSDIDDTVMVTALPRPFLAAWNTFVLNEHARTPTPGMAVLYDRLSRANPDAPVVYLSTGAWNVAPALTRFLSRNLYPRGPLLLTDWGPTPDRVFRSGRAHKVAQLERLAEEFPRVRWLLFGDDGQHDEDTYGGFADRHPENVAAIFIRQLSPGEAVLAGGRAARRSAGHGDVPWFYSPDGQGMAAELKRLELL